MNKLLVILLYYIGFIKNISPLFKFITSKLLTKIHIFVWVCVSFIFHMCVCVILLLPGGPCNKTPFGACVSSEPSNNSFLCIGNITVSLNSWITNSRPAMSLHVTWLIKIEMLHVNIKLIIKVNIIYSKESCQYCWLF